METSQILNPFGYLEACKLIDENRKPAEYWSQYLAENSPEIENEFYCLFPDGLLVKKGRSKFRTSQYLQGEKYQPIKNHYAKN